MAKLLAAKEREMEREKEEVNLVTFEEDAVQLPQRPLLRTMSSLGLATASPFKPPGTSRELHVPDAITYHPTSVGSVADNPTRLEKVEVHPGSAAHDTLKWESDFHEASPPRSPMAAPIPEIEVQDPSPIPPARTLNLAHFAHAPSVTPTLSARSLLSPVPSVVSLEGSEGNLAGPSKKPAKRTRKAAVATTGVAAMGEALTLLAKCPACQISWTTRKSSSAKEEHIIRCGKKAGMTTDQLLEGIRAQLESAPLDASKGKGKAKAGNQALLAPIPEAPKTFMGDVVDAAAPKKRTRKKSPDPITVKPAGETHNTILDRAKALLMDTQPEKLTVASSSKLPPLRSNSDVQLVEEEENHPPPPTQAFGKSRLAAAFRKPRSPSPPPPQPLSPPPPTQAFIPSKLAAARQPNALAFFDQYDTQEARSPSPRRVAINTFVVCAVVLSHWQAS